MTPPELVLDDVYGIWVTPFLQTPVGYAILLVTSFLSILGAYACFRYFKMRQGTPPERALRTLKALMQKVEKGTVEPKRVYQEVTGTIKSYVHWRYRTTARHDRL